MSFKRKVLICLLTVLICTTCTGCGLSDKIQKAFSNYQRNATTNSINNKISDIKAIGANADTMEQVKLLSEANDKLNRAKTTRNPFIAMFSDEYCLPRNVAKQNDKLIAKVNEQNRILDTALANDESYQKNKKAKTSGILKKIGTVVAIIAGLLLLMLLLKKLRRKKVKTKPAPAQAPVGNAVHTGLLNDGGKAKRDVQELCAANGIDFDRVVAKFGDDDRGMTRAKMKIEDALKRGGIEEVNDLL